MSKGRKKFNADSFVLRPWDEVARLYTERTGEKLTKSGAFMVARRGMKKIQEELRKQRE